MENKINIQFTRAELKTLITLLGMAGNEFSNHGCNDFNILNIGLPITAAHELRSQITDFSKEELEDNKDNPYLYDWMLYRLFEDKLEKILNNTVL